MHNKIVNTRRTIQILWTATAALTLGVGAAATDGLITGIVQDDRLRAVAMLLNAGTIWAALAFFAGWMARRVMYAPVAGFLSLCIAVIGYYAYGSLFGDRADIATAALIAETTRWLVVALLVGPVLGILGALSHRGKRLGMLASGCLAVGAALEVVFFYRLNSVTFQIDPWLAVAQTGLLLVMCAVSAILIVRAHKQTQL